MKTQVLPTELLESKELNLTESKELITDESAIVGGIREVTFEITGEGSIEFKRRSRFLDLNA